MSASRHFWQGREVLVTGHTGFKGSWLSLWLKELGAAVHGYALDPPTSPNLFDVAGVAGTLASDTRANVANLTALRDVFDRARPEIVFHLAAQPLVRQSYADPLETIQTNVVGTANVLQAVRNTPSVRAVVVVTTDKVYQVRESTEPFRESDPLGGRDPYSASKAAAEIIAGSYRDSFFGGPGGHPANVATVRSGNVIGGGDWATDRLLPDCFRAFADGAPVRLRYPNAIRPWQHVFDPLAGYLQLAALLGSDAGRQYASSWNFGPDAESDATVGVVADTAARLWGAGARVELSPSTEHPHETGVLRLDSTRARAHLGWRPHWPLAEALSRTVSWQRAWIEGADMPAVCRNHLLDYETAHVT